MLILTRTQKDHYESKFYERLQDYVLEHYNHVLPEAVPMLERQRLHIDDWAPPQRGVLVTLTKKGFFERKWSFWKGGTYWERTDQVYEAKKKDK